MNMLFSQYKKFQTLVEGNELYFSEKKFCLEAGCRNPVRFSRSSQFFMENKQTVIILTGNETISVLKRKEQKRMPVSNKNRNVDLW